MLSIHQNRYSLNTKKLFGVTLIEVLLVMVIASSILLMVIGYMQSRTDELRRNRAALQMQQVLNAGLAYYVAKGEWPLGPGNLTSDGFLPTTNLNNPWGQPIYASPHTATGGGQLFYVYTDVRTLANARIVSGRLPFGYISNASGSPPAVSTTCTGTTCYAVAAVNIPGQNLNNATAVNFAGMYHSGACVPVPQCPVDKDGNTMVPQAYAVPASVSGINDAVCSGSTCSQFNVYPLASYTAYLLGVDAQNNPANYQGSAASGPKLCKTGNPGDCYYDAANAKLPNQKYWRVCLKVTTERGVVDADNAHWGGSTGTILVFTRCATQREATSASGSPYAKFEVWQR